MLRKKTSGVARRPQSSSFIGKVAEKVVDRRSCLLYTSPSPRDKRQSRMPSSA